MRVLVIDDDASIGAAIGTLLGRLGSEVVFARNGRLGVQLLETSGFDLVMVDIFMPEMDGLETIVRFRQLRPNVPIIAMSGFRFRDSKEAAPDFLRMATELGAAHCLRKPFAPPELMAAIGACRHEALPEQRVARRR